MLSQNEFATHAFIINLHVSFDFSFSLPRKHYLFMFLRSSHSGSGSDGLFSHWLAPYSPCNSWAMCIMRKDARWGSDDWVSVLPLPHTSCVALRCYFLLGFNFLILKRRNWFIPGINYLFFAKGQIIHMSGLVGHLICVVYTLLLNAKARHRQYG